MTDQEVICTWMEPRPELPPYWMGGHSSAQGWWWCGAINAGGMQWFPSRRGRDLDLDALWEVEERLTDEQWHSYVEHLLECIPAKFPRCGQIVHATAEQKIKALAAVLRPIVTEGKEEAA